MGHIDDTCRNEIKQDKTMSNEREFDVVIFGATGFTGKLVAEYFQAQYGNDDNVKWAVAGRNEAKLNGVKKELGISESVASIVADGMNKITKSCKMTKKKMGRSKVEQTREKKKD